MFKQREIDCVITKRNSKVYRKIKVSQTCESDGFIRTVYIGQYFRTVHDVNDGFGGKTGSCREYTLPRDDQDSELAGSVQSVKSESHVVLINVELRYRYRPC